LGEQLSVFKAHSSISLQVIPFPEKPELQVQLIPGKRGVHAPFGEHSPYMVPGVVQSFCGVQVVPFPE